ncbi:MAG: ABC transporter permease subunit [Coriobacteriia bacterium]|jgi:ABC-type transport system involved in multi-copper enzyme maturation permease subunit|nr:ABC transporter permease subunit [Coriobacteriia bacterium]
MHRVLAVAQAVVSDAIRRRIVWVVALFALVLAGAIPMLPSYGVGVEGAVYREIALAMTYVAAMVVALVLSVARIPTEIERRTLYSALAREVRRWEYVFGTWLGIFITLGAVMIAFGAVIFGVGWPVYHEPMWQLWEGVLAIWLEAGVIAAFCVAVSTVSVPAVVSVAALAFLFVTHVRTGLLGGPENPMWHFYPSLDAFNIIAPVAHGSGVSLAYLRSMVAVFVGWAGALVILGALGFARRDL